MGRQGKATSWCIMLGMIFAYYEKQAQYPPTHVLPILAKALGVSIDQLLGVEKPGRKKKKEVYASMEAFTQIENLKAKKPKVKRRGIS